VGLKAVAVGLKAAAVPTGSAEAIGEGEGLKAMAAGLRGKAAPSTAIAAGEGAAVGSALRGGLLKSARKMRAKNGMRLQGKNAFLFTIILGLAKPQRLQKGPEKGQKQRAPPLREGLFEKGLSPG
jgi:hypothetical protein